MIVALPLVLIGPILRRVEPRLVSVFIATGQDASIHLSLYDGPTDAANPGSEFASGDSHTTRFGAGFFATVVVATLAEPGLSLEPGHRYSYDIRITTSDGTVENIHSLGMVTDLTVKGFGNTGPASEDVEINGISYVDGQLPSFVTAPATLEELVFVHASCRKPHGDGHPALKEIDNYVDGLDGATAGWPHMMFFTGDQIYADDVAAALLPGINQLGAALVAGTDPAAPPPSGRAEKMPSTKAGAAPLEVSMPGMPAGCRQRLTGTAGFTSEEAPCHLAGFGEYLAMYAISWNPFVWPVLAVADTTNIDTSDKRGAKLAQQLKDDAANSPATAPVVFSTHPPDAVLTPMFDTTPAAKEYLFSQRNSFTTDKARVDEFRREVPHVRRLMASIPTYMICDDHDVTDDFFMTGSIRTNTLTNPFGRALTRNALAAYSVVQAWGDDPLTWLHDPDHQSLLADIAAMFPPSWTGGLPDAAATATIDTILGLNPGTGPVFDFSYTLDGPFHRVRVLDTRTRRQYDSPQANPGLLTSAALDHQVPVETLPDDHILIVVSPAPVFGPPVLAEIGGPLLVSKFDLMSMRRKADQRLAQEAQTGIPTGEPTGQQYYDVEHWDANPPVFERLLERLAHYPRVVVLGGDVHYGAAYAMDWTGDGRTARILHFTSSAAKNAWTNGAPTYIRNLMLFNDMATGLQKVGLPMVRAGWADSLPPVVDDVSHEPPLARIAVQTGPVLLTDQLFRTRHPLTRPPDWIWRTDAIGDTRTERPVAAQTPQPASDLPADTTAVNHYGDLTALHVAALRTVAINRGLQYLCNAGVISFVTVGGDLRVRQSLYSLRARQQPNEKGDAYIVHEASLTPSPVAFPSTIGPAA
jgi:hypothetical protein